MKKVISVTLSILLIVQVSLFTGLVAIGKTDEDGNLYYNGEPLYVDGKWVNVDTGFNPDEETTEEETTEAPTFIEQICGTYTMTGTGHLTGEGFNYVDTDSPDADLDFTVTVSDAGNGKVNVSFPDFNEGESSVATVNEASGTAKFTLPYGYGYSYDCTMTFDVSDGGVSATLHMYVEGEDEGETLSETIDVSGTKN